LKTPPPALAYHAEKADAFDRLADLVGTVAGT
jgi:hypothetical protein